jgi:hypothetical protein
MHIVIIAFDVSLRNTGFFGKNVNGDIVYGVLKYKNYFSLEDFSTINNHLDFLRNYFKERENDFLASTYVIEADTFGMRKGGFKTKELLTIVRINLSYALKEYNPSAKIVYVRNFEWKKKLGLGIGGKETYINVGRNKLIEEFGKEMEDIKNHNIIDAGLIFLSFDKISYS